MKATLEFNLPDERSEHLMAVHGIDMACALSAIKNELRTFLKHGHTFKTADDALEAIQALVYDETSGLPQGLV